MPHRSSVPVSWRLAKHRYALVGTVCSGCGAKRFPPVSNCSECGSSDIHPFRFSGGGKILSYTTIHVGPDGFEKYVPYAVGLVQLDEGPVISAQVVSDCEKISIGKVVRVVFRKLNEDGRGGIINYGFKFELDE